MPCSHNFIKINDVSVCKRCGLTFTFDGKVVFDRPIANYGSKTRKKRRKR